MVSSCPVKKAALPPARQSQEDVGSVLHSGKTVRPCHINVLQQRGGSKAHRKGLAAVIAGLRAAYEVYAILRVHIDEAAPAARRHEPRVSMTTLRNMR